MCLRPGNFQKLLKQLTVGAVPVNRRDRLECRRDDSAATGSGVRILDEVAGELKRIWGSLSLGE